MGRSSLVARPNISRPSRLLSFSLSLSRIRLCQQQSPASALLDPASRPINFSSTKMMKLEIGNKIIVVELKIIIIMKVKILICNMKIIVIRKFREVTHSINKGPNEPLKIFWFYFSFKLLVQVLFF